MASFLNTRVRCGRGTRRVLFDTPRVPSMGAASLGKLAPVVVPRRGGRGPTDFASASVNCSARVRV
eukprot:2952285-Alexandrium_andersonii.AAC.1